MGIHTLQALALWERDAKERAVSTPGQALTLAEPEGSVRTFVDEGLEWPPRLQAARSSAEGTAAPARPGALPQGSCSPHWSRPPRAPPPTAELPEPLSERELEVLQLIEVGKSNRRIAPRTVVIHHRRHSQDPHPQHLPQAQCCHSRTQALVRARETEPTLAQREQASQATPLTFI